MGFFDFLSQRDKLSAGGITGGLYTVLRLAHQLVVSFSLHQGLLRAAALTFYTLLSLVPVLAIAFSVLKGLGVQNSLEPLLRQVAGDSQETISLIVGYVNNTNVKSLGVIGLIFLLFTAISLLERIEESFNAIWGVSENRSPQRRFSDYLSVIIVGPIMLLAATSITSGLQSKWLVSWITERVYFGDKILLLFQMLPYVSIWISTIFLYIFMPNTKIRPASAILGGILAGTAWQITQWGYFHFQVGVANYNAIYGAMSALPVLLVWIYTSWMIVLFGLEIVYAHQHRGLLNPLQAQVCSATREELALAILVEVCRHFRDKTGPPDSSQLAEELGLPLLQFEDSLTTLAELKYLSATNSTEPAWLPAFEPDRMFVGDVLSALRGSMIPDEVRSPALVAAADVLAKGRAGERSALDGLSMYDLLQKEPDTSG